MVWFGSGPSDPLLRNVCIGWESAGRLVKVLAEVYPPSGWALQLLQANPSAHRLRLMRVHVRIVSNGLAGLGAMLARLGE